MALDLVSSKSNLFSTLFVFLPDSINLMGSVWDQFGRTGILISANWFSETEITFRLMSAISV